MSPDPPAGPVRLEREGPLAVVSFDSPPLNLFDAALEAGLVGALDALEAEPARGVLFRAEGRAVSGGVDVSVFDAMSGPSEAEATFTRLIALSRRVEALACPVVFAAHALCLTWAFELALACDILLAAESASFGLVERVIGLTPAMGGTQRLAERAGTGRAKEFVMEGRPFGARELERWNVVNRCSPMTGSTRRPARTRGLWPTGRRVRTRRRGRSCARTCATASTERIGIRPRSPAGCSPPRTCRAPSPPSCATGRAGRRSTGADRGPALSRIPARSGRFFPASAQDWYVFRLWTGWSDPSAER